MISPAVDPFVAKGAADAAADGPLHILVAEDEPVTRLLVTRMLESWGYRVSVAVNGDEAWEILQLPDAPRLAVVDWMMPGTYGIDICRKLKADPERQHAYIIILAASHGAADVVTALEAGADDYIAKPFDVAELRVRVRAGQRIVDLQRELLRKASHDELTGMFNRRMVMEMLAREHAKALREKTCLSVAMMDLDDFKNVNDRFGHHVGDAVLQEAAKRLSAAVRKTDIAGRYGGEEFLLMMPQCDAKTAAGVAERVRRAISESPMPAWEHSLTVTASIGVATSSVPPTANHETLIADADRALYRAKSRGRNRVETGDSEPQDRF